MVLRLAMITAIGLSGIAAAAPCSELPVLFVVQDKSGSMNFDPNGQTPTASSPSKWSAAQSVVPALATQFTNRFRFGAMMYPAETSQFNCSTGVVKTPVSGDASAIGRSYSAALAGGGTSTAASLSAARAYLSGLHLTTPAYVLLITDGLPNCNESLNPATCTNSTPGCEHDKCELGAKDCLDNQAATSAAAALFTANIRVFVVGFDPSLTTGNNLSVLNAIASAGGTSTAYTATNKAQLASALNLIALNTATCCKDACTAGAQQCAADGSAQRCQFDAAIGCTVWSSQTCEGGKSCDKGQCGSSCQDLCTAGALRCANQNAEQCVKSGSGCTSWVAGATCDSGRGETCVEGVCKPTGCIDACKDGAFQCSERGPQVCVKATECTGWQDLAACGSKAMCAQGACRPSCPTPGELSTCSAGDICTQVTGGAVCLPSSGGGGNSKSDAGVRNTDLRDIQANAGCGCQVADSSALLGLAAMALMWARRRKV